MPLLSEMPRVSSEAARQSAKDLNRASAICILGTSGLTYWLVGFFGASMSAAVQGGGFGGPARTRTPGADVALACPPGALQVRHHHRPPCV